MSCYASHSTICTKLLSSKTAQRCILLRSVVMRKCKVVSCESNIETTHDHKISADVHLIFLT